ncbi:hypothetical protein ACI2KE_18815 [Pseudomonas monteilii]
MNIENMKQIVQAGRHLKDGEQRHLLRESSDDVSAYIDLIKYGAVQSCNRWIESEFLRNFRSLSHEEKVNLAQMDSEHVLSASLISELMNNDYAQWLSSPCSTIKEMASAIAIVLEDERILVGADNSLLYRYFVNARVSCGRLKYFSRVDFISMALEKIVSEERVIFTWVVLNIKSLIQASLLSPSEHRHFFKKLFEKYSYIQGEQAELFFAASSRDYLLFDVLLEVRLAIDPFTKQVDYSLWLRDSAKFLFLEKIRNFEGVSDAKRVSEFDRKLNVFKEIYKFDRSLCNS